MTNPISFQWWPLQNAKKQQVWVALGRLYDHINIHISPSNDDIKYWEKKKVYFGVGFPSPPPMTSILFLSFPLGDLVKPSLELSFPKGSFDWLLAFSNAPLVLIEIVKRSGEVISLSAPPSLTPTQSLNAAKIITNNKYLSYGQPS